MTVTGPIAAIVIAIVMCVFASFTALTLKGMMSIEMYVNVLSHAGALLVGVLLPITYRRKPGGQISFQIDSDPPPEEKKP